MQKTKNKKKKAALKRNGFGPIALAALAQRGMIPQLSEPSGEKINQQTWAQAAYKLIRQEIIPEAPEEVIVTYGFPKGKRGTKHLGQCWNHPVENQQAVIFIHPCQWTAPLEVLDTLTHEACHAATPGAGHRGAFKRLALSIGMRGPMRSASAGPELMQRLNGLAKELPEFPAAGFDPPTKKQESRLRLWVCRCPIKVRVASDVFKAICLNCESEFELVAKNAAPDTQGHDEQRVAV